MYIAQCPSNSVTFYKYVCRSICLILKDQYLLCSKYLASISIIKENPPNIALATYQNKKNGYRL